jgi:hypothetical protein
VKCMTLLHSVSLQSNVTDQWQWHLNLIGGYSIRGVYQLLTSHESIHVESEADLVWHNHVPLKVSIFAWILLRDRLSTKLNLVNRGIIVSEASFCTAGCGHVESTQHLFLCYSTCGSLWQSVRSWIGFSEADPQSFPDHLNQFIYSSGGLKARRSFLQLV